MFDKLCLVVDDAEDIRDPFVRFLTRRGFTRVLGAGSAGQALETIEKQKPDLILLDIQLEGDIDGLEILKRTKAGLSPHSHVVMISGHRELYEEKCKKLGALDFWTKPMDPYKIVDRIKALFPAEEHKTSLS
ncbi:MAG: response regulator [Candidatus Omnitrophica bacterium]|nr:response regulator [Candidatus Omnitrophota bacterium]